MQIIANNAIDFAVEQIAQAEGKNYIFQHDQNAPIFGGDEGFDSLNFAFFVVNIEEYIKEKLGVEIQLFDDYVFGLDPLDPKHPFANTKNLVNFLNEKIKLAQNE